MKNPCSKAEKQLRGEESGTKQRLLTVLARKKGLRGSPGDAVGWEMGGCGGRGGI